MAEPPPSNADRFDRLEKRIKAEPAKLTNDEGVQGTGLSVLGLMSLSNAYDNFRERCLQQLATQPTCTGMFNVMGRQQIAVEVNLPQLDAGKKDNVQITISNPEHKTARKVVFRPSGD